LHYRRLKSAVDELDPTGRRPLFSFGYSGGFNYMLGRRAASPLTHGFRLSPIKDPNAAVQLLRAASPPVIAVDNPYFTDRVPVPGVQVLRWQPLTRLNHYVRFDRPYFEAAVLGCRVQANPLREFTIYDCPERNGVVAATVR
jgi:hypothetical protein